MAKQPKKSLLASPRAMATFPTMNDLRDWLNADFGSVPPADPSAQQAFKDLQAVGRRRIHQKLSK